ncbi:uncharacterized protein A1O9_09810 [Exophiala aquamarina CBS 119918]|uniref:tRNA(Ile)-lysidine synthetase n=1 Tax=Exophiala aquamarina CBS 119918 TaxID=1182545 RepID=A0A072PEL7_9EURO|nr:uncharacterized protein A1O9_09810 [Exophiala aquamarina CBS 119918]KEF54015.1 hypothetical protein A1O9_09810 [Exophiala aquamarina CBS 119918]
MTVRQSAVQVTDLLTGVKKLWETSLLKKACSAPTRIGVCVSGGPDSMALAYLLSRIPQVDPSIRIEPIAFIVNHNARPGSRLEAERVGTQLRTHGKAPMASQDISTETPIDIESRILHMRWPEETNPLALPDFEMMARYSRYQLIAQAAIREKIQHLFLGHHLDDQLETIIMRLVRNTSFSFLAIKGMAETSRIPCCENIRGANESLDFPSADGHLPPDKAPQQETESWPFAANYGSPVGISELHGLQLHRPLLEFKKSQLIGTCQQHKVQYVSDETNFDPTITMRNAVRYMRAKFNLPRALQATSLLNLMAAAREHSRSLESRGNELASHFQIVEFDLRVGSMIVQLPQDLASVCERDLEGTSHALSSLTSVISPQPRDATPSLVPQARCLEFISILSSIRPQIPVSKKSGEAISTRQTLQGATLQIQQTQIEQLANTPGMGPGQSRWRLSRPTMRYDEIKAVEQKFEPEFGNHEGDSSGAWSKWILWDHRYWIRVRSRIATDLSHVAIRNFRREDVHCIVSKGPPNWRNFKSTLREVAPGNMRWTLPILTFADEISAFPTLNVRVQNSANGRGEGGDLPAHPPVLEWEMCYKVIDKPFIQAQKSKIVWKNLADAYDSNQRRAFVSA